MLLAEDLLLLVTDASGRLSAPAGPVDVALGGANLMELTLMMKVGLSGQWDRGRPGRIIVYDASSAGDGVLDGALGILTARQGRKPGRVVRPLGKNLRRTLYERLVLAGLVRAEHRRVLGVFRAERWPVQDAGHPARVRQQMTQALVEQATPETRGAALVALVHALGHADKIVGPRACGLSRQQYRARVAEIAEGTWASEAIRPALARMIVAIAAATSAARAPGSVT
jgi:hypothetical protein